MSKLVVSLPEGMVKSGCVGAIVSLICYVLLQFLVAFLICEEMIGEETLYPAVCMSAGISSFAGCWCGAVGAKRGEALSAATVVVVFLALTVVIGFFGGELGVDGDGLVGIGASMSAGGLVAAVLCGARGKKTVGRYEKGKRRHEKRSKR